MREAMAHTVNRQVFDLYCSGEDTARRLQHQVCWYTAPALEKILTDILQDLSGSQEHHLIGRLEIDLGDMTEVEFGGEEMLERFRTRCTEKLAECLADTALPQSGTMTAQTRPPEDADWEMTKEFLLTGVLPWWADRSIKPDMDRMMVALIRNRPSVLAAFLQELLRAKDADAGETMELSSPLKKTPSSEEIPRSEEILPPEKSMRLKGSSQPEASLPLAAPPQSKATPPSASTSPGEATSPREATSPGEATSPAKESLLLKKHTQPDAIPPPEDPSLSEETPPSKDTLPLEKSMRSEGLPQSEANLPPEESSPSQATPSSEETSSLKKTAPLESTRPMENISQLKDPLQEKDPSQEKELSHLNDLSQLYDPSQLKESSVLKEPSPWKASPQSVAPAPSLKTPPSGRAAAAPGGSPVAAVWQRIQGQYSPATRRLIARTFPWIAWAGEAMNAAGERPSLPWLAVVMQKNMDKRLREYRRQTMRRVKNTAQQQEKEPPSQTGKKALSAARWIARKLYIKSSGIQGDPAHLLMALLQWPEKELLSLEKKWKTLQCEKLALGQLIPLLDAHPGITKEALAGLFAQAGEKTTNEYPDGGAAAIEIMLRQFDTLLEIGSMQRADEYAADVAGRPADTGSKILLENAGLCLIVPYLGYLCRNLGYVRNDLFKNSRCAHKAIYLLQYLATGSYKIPEYMLPLNKILCGLNIGDRIPAQLRLGKKELAEADKMLAAVIANWDMLGNTSPDGLRGTFFCRNGVLQDLGSHWLLQVERKEYDILLNGIPWGYSMLRLPWMKKHIIVEW